MKSILEALGLREINSGVCGAYWVQKPGGHELISLNPSTGKPIAAVVTAGGNDYERSVADAARAFEQLTPIDFRHRDVGNHHRDGRAREQRQRFARRATPNHIAAASFENRGQQFARILLIVDDEHGGAVEPKLARGVGRG